MSLVLTNPATGFPYTDEEWLAYREDQRQWRMANDECADPLTGASVENWAECNHERDLRRSSEWQADIIRSHASQPTKLGPLLAIAAVAWLLLRSGKIRR